MVCAKPFQSRARKEAVFGSQETAPSRLRLGWRLSFSHTL